ncbi:hypothetical protein [Geodermatophilus sp. SYSU D00079]
MEPLYLAARAKVGLPTTAPAYSPPPAERSGAEARAEAERLAAQYAAARALAGMNR